MWGVHREARGCRGHSRCRSCGADHVRVLCRHRSLREQGAATLPLVSAIQRQSTRLGWGVVPLAWVLILMLVLVLVLVLVLALVLVWVLVLVLVLVLLLVLVAARRLAPGKHALEGLAPGSNDHPMHLHEGVECVLLPLETDHGLPLTAGGDEQHA